METSSRREGRRQSSKPASERSVQCCFASANVNCCAPTTRCHINPVTRSRTTPVARTSKLCGLGKPGTEFGIGHVAQPWDSIAVLGPGSAAGAAPGADFESWQAVTPNPKRNKALAMQRFISDGLAIRRGTIHERLGGEQRREHIADGEARCARAGAIGRL